MLSDSPHLLYRFKVEPGVSVYDVNISHRGSTTADVNFTLRAFSQLPLKIVDGPAPFPYSTKLAGRWTERSAGGNHTCPTFMNNPQYRVVLSAAVGGTADALADLNVVCEAEKEMPVNVKLVRMRGERVSEFEERDLVAGAAKYSYGRDSCDATGLRIAPYTLLVSSFSPRDEGAFDVTISATLPIQASLIPAEGAGMFSRTLRASWSPSEDGGSENVLANPRFLLDTSGKTVKLKIRLQLTTYISTPIGLSIFSQTSDGQPPRLVKSTGPYSDAVSGAVTDLMSLPPSPTGEYPPLLEMQERLLISLS
ncbi:calcium-dependent cysteine-type endopeptidase [Pseudohyphozyma bogoriensis]|nr:calcium-dependent cysteine-type endopeptidase [Pseudohyphozyma bogoriensis]